MDGNGAQGLYLDTAHQEVGKEDTESVTSGGGERREVLEPKGRNDTGGGRPIRSSAAKGSRNGRTDMILGLVSMRAWVTLMRAVWVGAVGKA